MTANILGDDAIEERLSELEAVIREFKSGSDQLMDILHRIVDAVATHGDAELLQRVQTIFANDRTAAAASFADLHAGDAVH